MVKHIHLGWAKPGDDVVLGGNLRIKSKPQSQPKRVSQPSKPLSEEQERLVAEIKRHHPEATTEEILEELEAWGVSD